MLLWQIRDLPLNAASDTNEEINGSLRWRQTRVVTSMFFFLRMDPHPNVQPASCPSRILFEPSQFVVFETKINLTQSGSTVPPHWKLFVVQCDHFGVFHHHLRHTEIKVSSKLAAIFCHPLNLRTSRQSFS